LTHANESTQGFRRLQDECPSSSIGLWSRTNGGMR
jgi:hypothetical protein